MSYKRLSHVRDPEELSQGGGRMFYICMRLPSRRYNKRYGLIQFAHNHSILTCYNIGLHASPPLLAGNVYIGYRQQPISTVSHVYDIIFMYFMFHLFENTFRNI